MIRDTPKEDGAVYWDDPDHMQAARTGVEEPDLTSAKSSLRASLKSASPVIKGTLATHTPSYHGNFTLGQGPISPTEPSPIRPGEFIPEPPSDELTFKPANEQEVKSWSFTESSDMLF
ncbi:hypothetical protein EB796_014917 [Bugula neritina]|uniref:Uncharacterized protein n=1 Tax=Bugula neritina TaxID=10212 RepID=A0A7J7JKW1_BUGNE|nr:hypothetical protein EB796_014917 [Bugula neritina]